MGNLCCGGGKRTFKWRIEGFSSLLKLQEVSSREFNVGGYRWNFVIKPKEFDVKSGKGCIGLYLNLIDASSLPSDMVVKAVFRLRIYDQLNHWHWEEEAICYFQTMHGNGGIHNIISLKEFKNPTSGFLVNDNCIFSVSVLRVRARKVEYFDGMSECLSLQKKTIHHSYRWKIENFSELQRPQASSGNFVAGGHKWNLVLHPDGIKKNNSLAIFLELVSTSTLPLNSQLYVEFSLCLMDQINGKHKKYTGKEQFDSEASTFGQVEFLPLEDFQDPSKGFLIENACIVEASVVVLGLVVKP